MTGPVDLLERASKTMHGVLGGVSKDQLDRSTPCADFDLRSLVNHIVGGTFMFGAVVAGQSVDGQSVDGQSVDGQSVDGHEAPDFSGGDFAGDYDRAAQLAVEAFNADGAFEQAYQFPFGEMPGALTFHILLSETLVHGWDVATATGQSFEPDPDIVQASYDGAKGNIGADMRGPGKFFGPEVSVPDDAPVLDRLVGYMGRRP